MKNHLIISIFVFCFLAGPLLAQENSDSSFALSFTPGVNLPIGRDADAFTIGGSTRLLARLKIMPHVFLDAGADFGIAPVDIAAGEPADRAILGLVAPQIGLTGNIGIGSRLSLGARLHGGYYFGFLSDVSADTTTGHNPMISAGAFVSYRLVPTLSLGFDAFYRNFFGLYNDVVGGISVTYHFPARAGGVLIEGLKPYKQLSIEDIVLGPVFPVFYKYYKDYPIGKLTLKNKGKIPLESVKVNLFVNQYMDNPHASGDIEFIRGGEESEIDLFALFNNKVLGISEGEIVQVNISVECTVGGDSYGNEVVESMRLYDRNAVTWADDRRAAAFVTAKDPAVLRFSRNINSMVKDKIKKGFNQNLLKAIAFHEALTLVGVEYEIDPVSSYIELSKSTEAVDYLQFPNQTLEYKSGDCDDLSILNCALLESVAIESAFITIPGHIYIAFSLDMSPAEAQSQFSSIDDLIFMDDKAWVPLEITQIGDGFLRAWEVGAKQWRENKDGAGFFPVREAWKLYEPVGFAGRDSIGELPAAELVVERYQREVTKLVERELYPRVSELEKKIAESQNDPRYINKLAVLYARYGAIDRAEEQFRRILEQGENLAALINMGNIAFLQREMDESLSYFRRASRLKPDNPRALLGMARAYHELGDHSQAQSYYSRLEKEDVDLAKRYAYLDPQREQVGARAAEAERLKEVVAWEEE